MANKIVQVLIISLLTIALTACLPFGTKSKLHFKDFSTSQIEEVVPDVVSYSYLNREVLVPHCVRCHEKMGNQEQLGWWIVSGDPEESELFLAMEDGSMPPNRAATTRELEIVRRYIEQLKPRNPTNQ